MTDSNGGVFITAGNGTDRKPVEMDRMLQRSSDIASMVPYWDQVLDITGGIRTMRAASTTYLPMFVDEEKASYQYRLKCTKMTNVFRDIVEGLAAKPFEHEVTLPDGEDTDDTAPPEDIVTFTENVDGAGNNLTVFSGLAFFNAIRDAVTWIFVDNPVFDRETIRTKADEKAANIRPYWSHVLAKNVIEVKSIMNGSNETITYFKVLEPGKPDHIREFTRVGNVVTWALYEKRLEWRQLDGGEQTQFFQVGNGTLAIDTIPFVPIITGRRNGRTWAFDPAMLDAADLQVDLYQQESALKYIGQLAGYPMLAGNGIKPPKDAKGNPEKLAVGPGRVLYSPADGNGNVGSWAYVEPGAQSMTFLASNIEATKQDLRELGRQPLTAQSGNLTVITTAVAAGKARTAVGAWALGLKDALENAFVITAKYLAIKYDPVVDVFTDFDEFIDGKDSETIIAAVNGKVISRKTARFELKRRNILSADFNEEAEQKELLKDIVMDDANNDDPPPPEDKSK